MDAFPGCTALRTEMVEIGRRMYAAGFVAATDGNISVRDTGRIWITPTGCALGSIENDHFVAMSPDGQVLTVGQPSSEYALHLEVYRQRPDVKAVIHAHPPLTSAFMFSGQAHYLAEPVIPEVVATFGTIPMASYATPASEEGPAAIRELILHHDVILLERHGSLCVGASLSDAFLKLEKLEHAASIIMNALRLGGLVRLSDDELRRLDAVKHKKAPTGRVDSCELS